MTTTGSITNTNAVFSHHALTDGGRSSQITTTSSTTRNTNTNTASSHHALTDGGQSSQMTTTTNMNTASSHHALTDGGRSSQITTTTLTTNNTDTNTPSHSLESTFSPAHTTYSRRGSSTTAVTKVGVTPKSSPGNSSGQLSSVCLSTPALSSYASLKSTPIPTPQHSVTGHTMSVGSFRRPSLITHSVVTHGPSNGYPSSSNASDQLTSRVPGYDYSASDQYENDRMEYYHSSRPTSVATAPSTIRRITTRGSVNQCRPPSYEQARMIPPESNRATANSSFVIPSAISAPPLEPSDTEGRATENVPSVAVCSDNACRHCGEKTARVSCKETRSSQGSTTQGRVYVPSYNANPSHEQSQQSHHSTESSRGAAQVDTANSLVQSDHEMGHGPYHVRSVGTSNVMSFNGAQTPMATSTPSRRDAVLNARHVHAQKPYYARDKLSERFKDSRDSRELSEGENEVAGVGIPASSKTAAGRSRPVASNQNTFPRYSSTPASHSPQNQRKSSEDFTAYSTHSSPTRSQAQYYCGYSSGVSSSAQSSPGHGYSSTRRASSPALYYTDARRKSYGERIVQEHGNGKARHSDNNMGRYPEDSSGDSGEERNHDRNAYLSSEGHGEAYAVHDDRTPHVHVHVPTSARRVSIRRRQPSSHYCDDHYSDSETSPEHHYHGHAKPQVVKVVKTPKLRKRQVVYLASKDMPPEEIYYSKSGSGLFTPQQISHGRRVVGVVESRNGRSLSRDDRRVRVARVRGSKPRKVYMEQPSEPVKRVYIVERESESESDLEQIETIEVSRKFNNNTLAGIFSAQDAYACWKLLFMHIFFCYVE